MLETIAGFERWLEPPEDVWRCQTCARQVSEEQADRTLTEFGDIVCARCEDA